MDDEPSIVRATDAATDWLVSKGYTHVLIEVANEADNAGFKYDSVKPSGGAVRLKGQASWQASQPKRCSPTPSRSSSAGALRCSMVRYETQRRESST